MIRLCEIIGLTAYEMGEVTGYVMAVITFSVFFGIGMFYILITLIGTFVELVEYICKLFRKHFPNVWKSKRRS